MHEAIVKGFYLALRNFKGMSDEDILNMPAPRFWLLLDLLYKESVERDKQSKKHGR